MCLYFYLLLLLNTIIKKETVTKYSIQKAFQLCPNGPSWTDSFGILSCLAFKSYYFCYCPFIRAWEIIIIIMPFMGRLLCNKQTKKWTSKIESKLKHKKYITDKGLQASYFTSSPINTYPIVFSIYNKSHTLSRLF